MRTYSNMQTFLLSHPGGETCAYEHHAQGHLEKEDVIHCKFPWVTDGKELRYHSHGLLMGKNYVIYTLGYSWDRITCFH